MIFDTVTIFRTFGYNVSTLLPSAEPIAGEVAPLYGMRGFTMHKVLRIDSTVWVDLFSTFAACG
jgi:hypothetical protein